MYLHFPSNNNILTAASYCSGCTTTKAVIFFCISSGDDESGHQGTLCELLGYQNIYDQYAIIHIGILDHEELAPLYSGGQLTSTIIARYQHLLKSKYNVGGLEDPVYGLQYEFSTQRGHFVQVLHVNQDHWIVVSNMNSKQGMENTYVYRWVPPETFKN